MRSLHKYEMEILRQLLFKPNSRFTDLNILGLTSDHFSYYVMNLVELGLIDKVENKRYSLTNKGKEHANTMDTDEKVIEKQPKVVVMIIAEKKIDGVTNVIVQTRLKEPYYGFQGFMTGKVRYGETIENAARRELMEECGVTAEKVKLKFILHEHVFSKEGELLEDKIFHIIQARNIKGELIDFEGGRNEWLPISEYKNVEKKYYSDDDIFDWYMKPPKEFFVEKAYTTDQF